MMYELHFIDSLLYHIADERISEPWYKSNDREELEQKASELRQDIQRNYERIEGYWAQIWVENEFGNEVKFF